MANPAELLHATLTNWRSMYRTHNAPADEQRIAARHLDAIEELLARMDTAGIRTDLFRKHFDKWVSLTFHHPHEWQGGAGSQHIDDTPLEGLDHLGDRLKTLVPTLQAGGLDDVRAYADAARRLLDDDDTINPDFRAHTLQVIAHLRSCIDNYEAVGDFDLSEAVDRLYASMLKTARTSTSESHRGDWKTWFETVIVPFTVNVAAAIPSQWVAQLALGSGGAGG